MHLGTQKDASTSAPRVLSKELSIYPWQMDFLFRSTNVLVLCEYAGVIRTKQRVINDSGRNSLQNAQLTLLGSPLINSGKLAWETDQWRASFWRSKRMHTHRSAGEDSPEKGLLNENIEEPHLSPATKTPSQLRPMDGPLARSAAHAESFRRDQTGYGKI